MSIVYNGTTVDSIKYNGTTLTKVIYNGTTVYEESPTLTELCFTSNTAGSTVELTVVGSPSIANTAYSTDRTTWTTFTPSTTAGTNTITLANAGDKVYFRNDITANLSSSNYMKFVMSGSISASGNINSMYDADGFNDLTTLTYQYCYRYMFHGCTSLTTAPSLPATTLASSCYFQMFRDCTSLTTAPALPATTLAEGCYSGMFYGCTSLTTAPTLPATTLASDCYSGMFNGCTSLTTAPSLPATTLASWCYGSMFRGCTSLIAPSSLPATTLASSCYNSMFYGCTSLYVSDTQTTEATYTWNIPTSGTFTNTSTYNQTSMFSSCLGTRSSNTMSGALGGSHTYYTQNQPV